MNKIKDRPLTIVTTEMEIENMEKNKEDLISKIGEAKYNKLLGLLKEYLESKND